MKALILLNGPPRSGKDTVAKILWEAFEADYSFRFANPLRKAIAAFLGVDMFGWGDHHVCEWFGDLKGKRTELTFNAEVREMMIDLSERWAKPLMGDDVFGRLMVRTLSQHIVLPDIITIADAGFSKEVLPVVHEFLGKIPILLIHISRDGCEWDSREPFPTMDQEADPTLWWWIKKVDHISIDNSELTKEEFEESAMNMVEAWMNSKGL